MLHPYFMVRMQNREKAYKITIRTKNRRIIFCYAVADEYERTYSGLWSIKVRIIVDRRLSCNEGIILSDGRLIIFNSSGQEHIMADEIESFEYEETDHYPCFI